MASWELHKYYRGVVLPMLKERLNELKICTFKITNLDAHQLIKILTKTKTTANLDNKDYLLFLEEVWCIGAHLGIVIPNPNERTHMEKIQELSDKLVEIYAHVMPFISTTLSYNLGAEVSVKLSLKYATLTSHLFTDYHLDITYYKENGKTFFTTYTTFNDHYVEDISRNLTVLFNETIKPSLSKDKMIASINTKIEALQNEKATIENQTSPCA